ncbi:MAG: sulfur carrier protein ThiS [Deltaproteobacteria bacterium]|jgi:sulfur carrier protein|nr:sulfur carrier protein ThiS [Deltaproteobacteria bacterium]
MQITCNGQQREVEVDMSLASMLDSLSLPADSVVAEINMKIIDRDQYETTRLSDGDQVELIRFVGGG